MIPDARTAYYVSNNGRLQQLASGRLVLSTCQNGLLAVYSDDGGKSWKMSGRVTARTRIGGDLRMEEPGTFAKTDGTLVMYCRTNDDYQYWTESKDGGATWGPLVPSPLRSPRSSATIGRLADGRLCCVWNDHENHPDYRFLFPYHNGGRQPLTVGYSSDDGRTWTDRVDIETEGWLCYPAFKEIDGRLFILYCFGDGMKSMRLTALPVDAESCEKRGN